MSEKYSAFREKLDAEHKWPSKYMFKFIVPKEQEGEMYESFPQEEWKWEIRSSKNGAYSSFTSTIEAKSADEIIEIYQKAHKIEGIIAL